jgi:hypothetical protein
MRNGPMVGLDGTLVEGEGGGGWRSEREPVTGYRVLGEK